MNTDKQYREVLGYYVRGRDEGYPLDPDLIPQEGGDEYRADFDRLLARVKRDAAREALIGFGAEWDGREIDSPLSAAFDYADDNYPRWGEGAA